MKRLLFILGVIFSVVSFAQVVGGGGQTPGPLPGPTHIIHGSQLAITPVWPVQCLENTVRYHLNSVYNIDRIDETDETVTFRFFTQYQQCNLGTLLAYRLEGHGSVAEVISKKFVLFHTNGVPMSTRYELSRPDEMQVTVTFYKNRIFRRATQKSKDFQMIFVPHPRPDGRHFMFWWNVRLERDTERGSYEMKISQGNG